MKGLLICYIRRIFLYSPLRKEAKAKAKVGKYEYTCAKCKKNFEKVMVDHIDPVVDPKVGFVDWNTYIERMFCDSSNIQVLCRECHAKKTKAERGKPKRGTKPKTRKPRRGESNANRSRRTKKEA